MGILTDGECATIRARSWPATPYLIDALFLPVLCELETVGTHFDPTGLPELEQELRDRKDLAISAIRGYAGWDINLNAPHQVARLLFDQIGLKPRKIKRGTGNRSTDKEVLADLDHYIVDLIEDFREADKLANTYVSVLSKNASVHNGRLVTPYNNTSVETGRLSSGGKKKGGPTAFNVQNIPRRTEIGRRLRRHFSASPGNTLVSVDASQFQLRIAAVDAGEPVWIDAFRRGIKPHNATAIAIFGSDEGKYYDVAKTLNFGVLFGATEQKSLRVIRAALGGVDEDTARGVLRSYFAGLQSLTNRIAAVHRSVKALGYAEDYFGRRNYYELSGPRWAIEKVLRESYNFMVQGPEASIAKLFTTMILRWRDRLHARFRIVIHCHDEGVFDCPADELPLLQRIVDDVQREINELLDWPVPVVLSMGHGPNWAEAH